MKMSKLFQHIFAFLLLVFMIQKIDAQIKNKQKLYFYFDAVDENLKTFTKTNKIEKVLFIDEHAVSTGQYLGLDADKLKQNIVSLYPNISDTGLCYIDIESPYIDHLINENENSPKFRESLDYFIKIIKTAKSIRPKVKWGFYGVPFTTYWDLEKDFFSKYQKLKPLLEISDAFFPSMYFFYSDEEPNGYMNDKFARKNIQELIKVGKQYNKPVYPFVMERYHPSNQKIGLKKIPEKEFLKYMNIILNESYKGKKVDGIIWWNADKYGYNHNLYKEEFRAKDINTFIQRNNESNIDLMKKILKFIK